MINNFIFFKKKILNKQIEKIFFYLILFGIIVSINTNSSLLHFKKFKLFEIINFLRALSPLVIFSILFLYLLINIKNLNFFKNRSIYLNVISICLLFYTLISILGLSLNNDQFFFDRIWWNISYLNVIIYLYLGSYFFGDKFIKNVFLILLLFIFCFYLPISFIAIIESITLEIKNVYHSRLLAPDNFILDQGLPRTSGVARALFFLFLLHLTFLCFKKNYFYINLFICSLYVFVISVFESRITTIFFLISLLVIFYSELNFLKKIGTYLILILIFSYSGKIYESILILQAHNNTDKYQDKKEFDNFFFKKNEKRINILFGGIGKKKSDKEKSDKKKSDKNNEEKLILDATYNENNNIIFFQKKIICNEQGRINLISSGRLCIWVDNLNTAFKNYSVFLFGHGAQADRYNVKYSFKTQEHSASNTFIYVLSSGGAISVIFVLVIYIILLINFLKYFIFTKNKISNKSSILISCLLMNSFILFRGVTESSFAVFSLDYMLFLISTFIIFSNKNTNIIKI